MDNESNYWTPEEQDRFEQYLLEQMDDAARADFENKLAANPVVKEKLQEFIRAFRAVEEEEMWKRMEAFHRIMETEPKVRALPQKTSRTFYRIAAAVVLLVGLAGVWYYYAPVSHERLFNRYFVADPGLPTAMGNEDNYAFYEAMVAYKMGDYPAAIAKWEKLQTPSSKNDTLSYFLAMAHLANGDAPQTIAILEQNLTAHEPPFPEETHYYLGMAFLKQGHTEKAIRHLRKSGLPDAQTVLKSLE